MTTSTPQQVRIQNTLTSGRLPNWAPWTILVGSLVAAGIVFGITSMGSEGGFNIAGTVVVGALLYFILIYVFSRSVEGPRRAADRFVTALVTGAFIIALLPLVSVLSTTVANGLARFDGEFFSSSMRNVVGEGGGAVHAIWGTLLISLTAALISVPIGLLTSIYLVEYGRGKALARAITFFVDVMTGIPSIIAGLFAVAFFSLILGPGVLFGLGGAIALSVLMIPVVVRSSEEMLRLVPDELREASYALGVPKWLTIVKVVLPTSIAGITTGIMLAIARVIGETAPLLLIAGATQSLNTNLADGAMMTLPVFVYNSYMSQGVDAQAYVDRAWAGALTLVLIVMALNILARLIAKFFAPKAGR